MSASNADKYLGCIESNHSLLEATKFIPRSDDTTYEGCSKLCTPRDFMGLFMVRTLFQSMPLAIDTILLVNINKLNEN